jgi:cell division protease FtsH
MVTEFGMSEKLGTVRYAGEQSQYLGGMSVDDGLTSQETRQNIDSEVQRIVSEQYERALSLLTEHRKSLESLTRQLLEHESLDGSAVKLALEAE